MNTSDLTSSGNIPTKETQTSYQDIDFKKKGLNMLRCSKCNNIIECKDIDVEKTTATCSNCHNVFGFDLFKPHLTHNHKEGDQYPD